MKILFLDIDGVLNDHEFNRPAMSCGMKPECIAHLNQIVAVTEASIVLSSAWRYMLLATEFGEPVMTLRGFEYLMRTHGAVGFRLIGTTQSDEDAGWTMENNLPVRGKQIRQWLRENRHLQIDRYVVLDDIDLGISADSLPFVQTDGKKGLTAESAADVIQMLNRGVVPA